MTGAKKTARFAQPRVTMGPVVLNATLPASMCRRMTRAEIMVAGAPTVLGYDSSTCQESLPGEWTLVDKANMEGRQVQMTWTQSTNQQLKHLSKELERSLKEHKHPFLEESLKNRKL